MDLKQKERRRNRCVLCAMIDTTAVLAKSTNAPSASAQQTKHAHGNLRPIVLPQHIRNIYYAPQPCMLYMLLGGMIPVGLARARRKMTPIKLLTATQKLN
jgi:hypothetical protein